MAVVIRLQGLSIAAGSQDIRKFFTGLRIPDGGVHIVGGKFNEAFIIFGSDEDARIAMTKSGNYIKGSPVMLLLSSKTEMQNLLERSSMNLVTDQRKMLNEKSRPLKVEEFRGPRRSSGRLGYSPPTHHRRASGVEKDRQLMLRGMPFSVTENDVLKFFEGLAVEKMVILQNNRGQNNGNGLVTFASKEDATHGLKRHKKYIGARFVEIYTLKEWQQVFGEIPLDEARAGMAERPERLQQLPPRNQETSQYHIRSRSPLARGPSPSSGEYCVLLDNLSHAVEKHDIMKFFNRARLGSDQILYLLDGSGSRSRRAFVLFKSLQDYRDALDRDNRVMMNRNINVRPISREKMLSLLEDQKLGDKSSVHIRSLPFDVRKVEIMDFLIGLNVAEDGIIILTDHKGNGLGEAIVSFQTEEEAMEAVMLNGRRFLGSEVRLRRVSQSEMEDMIKPPFALGSSSRENRNFDTAYVTDTDFLPKRPLRDERSRASRDLTRGSQSEGRESARGGARPSAQDGPTCIKLVNLPFNLKVEEVYDFCYGYKIIPGSVSLQYDKNGASKGTATVVFESRQEALTAIDELTGRPIGQRKIQLVFL